MPRSDKSPILEFLALSARARAEVLRQLSPQERAMLVQLSIDEPATPGVQDREFSPWLAACVDAARSEGAVPFTPATRSLLAEAQEAASVAANENDPRGRSLAETVGDIFTTRKSRS